MPNLFPQQIIVLTKVINKTLKNAFSFHYFCLPLLSDVQDVNKIKRENE